jgi:hypothetical protein
MVKRWDKDHLRSSTENEFGKWVGICRSDLVLLREIDQPAEMRQNLAARLPCPPAVSLVRTRQIPGVRKCSRQKCYSGFMIECCLLL